VTKVPQQKPVHAEWGRSDLPQFDPAWNRFYRCCCVSASCGRSIGSDQPGDEPAKRLNG